MKFSPKFYSDSSIPTDFCCVVSRHMAWNIFNYESYINGKEIEFINKTVTNSGIRVVIEDFIFKPDEKEILFGYYPQDAVDMKIDEYLSTHIDELKRRPELDYSIIQLNLILSYLYDGSKYNISVYEYDNKLYARFALINHDNLILKNRVDYSNRNYVWLKVEPIKWIYDKDNNLLISKDKIVPILSKNLVEDVPVERYNKYLNGNFKYDLFRKEMLDKEQQYIDVKKDYLNNELMNIFGNANDINFEIDSLKNCINNNDFSDALSLVFNLAKSLDLNIFDYQDKLNLEKVLRKL